MKSVVLVIAFIVAIGAVQFQDTSMLQFKQFMKQYNKQYNTPEEYALRFANFKDSLRRAEEKNSSPNTRAQWGITKFSDLSVDEFQNTILMSKPIKPHQGVRDVQAANVEVPVVLDWRDNGAVTPVKNQEQCGSCWAFSTTENVESMWILAGKGNASNVDFAPQQIVDCDTSDYGCEGGNPNTAYEYLISAGGIEPESDYPYTAETGTCKFKSSDIVGKISSWKWACDYTEEETLQTNLIAWGPLSICVDATSWQDYQSGVLTWYDCAIVNELDHCVMLVGYNSQNSTNEYWMVRNSWGTDWGIQGYIWLEMWEDTCGITYEASTSVV